MPAAGHFFNATFPSQVIQRLITTGAIVGSNGTIADRQIQPASLDLTLSEEAYQLPGSVLPLRSEPVREIIQSLSRRKLNLANGELLDRSKVYLIRLNERVRLPSNVVGYTNNKSSTGRIDLATRLVCDFNPRYDKIPEGYEGELWLEVIPKSFDVRVEAGLSLNQAIFYAGRHILRSDEMLMAYGLEGSDESSPLKHVRRRGPLLFDKHGFGLGESDIMVEDGLMMTLDLDQDLVGYLARKTSEAIDLSQVGGHDADDFFLPVERPKHGRLWLERGRFYIFSTWEFIRVPPDYAVEMLPYDTSAGEFRAHYAGFFDPGFGYGLEGEEKGTPAVLEVRSYEDDLIIRHRQPICRMAYEVLSERPSRLYHASMGSNYAHQRGPQLSKFFRRPSP